MTACVVIPVLNEQEQLAESVLRVIDVLSSQWRGEYVVVIADNGSTDLTPQIAAQLAQRHAQVRNLRLEERGRGRALRAAWLSSNADVLAYLDVDLSTDLCHLTELLLTVTSREWDVAIGSRLHPQSIVKRSFKREILSRGYNKILRIVLGLKCKDAQCGFKAISRAAAQRLIPLIENGHWFFDTELLVLAQQNGFRVGEIPVIWVEDTDSRVKIVNTIAEDLWGVGRLAWRRFWPKRRELEQVADPK